MFKDITFDIHWNVIIEMKVGEKKIKNTIRLITASILLISIFLAVQIKHVKFDYDFEKFYPTEDEDTQFFESFTI